MGRKYLVNGLECRLQDSQVIPSQACRFRNFFLGPIPDFFSARCSSHVQEIPQIMSTRFARNAKSGFLSRLFVEFPGNATNFVGSAGSTLFEEFHGNATKNLQKKVPEWGPEKSSGICGPGGGSWAKPWPSPDFKVGPKPSFGPALIVKSGQTH